MRREELEEIQKNLAIKQTKRVGSKKVFPILKESVNLATGVPEDRKVGEAMDKETEIVEGFGRWLLEDEKSCKTIESYVGDVTGLFGYLEKMETEFDGELKRFQITSYRNYLLDEGYEASTINKKINSLQAFNRWMIGCGIMTDSVVDLRKDRVQVANGSEKQVEVFSEKQLDRLLLCVQGQKVSIRDRTIVMVLLYTGVRVSELCSIKVKHIDLLTGHIRIAGKGGKLREIPMKTEVAEAIKQYLTERI